MNKIKAKLVENNQLTDNIYQLKYEVISGEMAYKPGQYLMIDKELEGQKIKRAYSISSTVKELPIFDLTVRRFPDGKMSSWLTNLGPGEEIEMIGPLGLFTADMGSNKQKILIAIGCGIAPLKAMLERWVSDEIFSVKLFYGNRFLSGIPYHNYFLDLAIRNNNFDYYPCVSRLEKPVESIYAGRVYDVMAEELSDFTDVDFYLCGSKEMIAQVREFLVQRGVNPKNIFFEQIFI